LSFEWINLYDVTHTKTKPLHISLYFLIIANKTIVQKYLRIVVKEHIAGKKKIEIYR